MYTCIAKSDVKSYARIVPSESLVRGKIRYGMVQTLVTKTETSVTNSLLDLNNYAP